MKSIISVLLIIILPFLAFSQQSFPLIKDGGVWRVVKAAINTPPDPWWIIKKQYLMQGDTVYNNITYKKIYECNYSPSINNKVFFGGIRKDSTDKVFFFLDTNKSIIPPHNLNPLTEYLLYDFSLNVGDTLQVKNFQDSVQIVQFIDSVFIGNEFRKRWNLSGNNQTYIISEWIEGIGSVQGLFYPVQFIFEESQLLTCYEDTSLFWTNPILNGLDCFSVGIKVKQSPMNSLIEIFPNPASDHITIDFNRLNTNKMTFFIYNVLGQQIKTYHFTDNEKRKQLNIDGLKNGIYFYKWVSSNKIIGTGKFIKE